jgi:hypothetical protein
MTTAYTSLLGLALPVTGELSGTWGDTVNNSITSLLDSAIAGTTTLSSDADVTLTTTTGASNTSRQAILLWTAGGTVTRNITAPAQSKIYTVINKSSSTQSIVLRGVGPTTGVTIVQGESAVCAWNGTDFIKISNTSGAGVFTTLSVTGVATFSAGTAALPAITTTGDTNTGIWFPAADTIAFTEGGVESMRIDASGNMGLGVTPSAWSVGKAFELTNPGNGLFCNAASTNRVVSNAYFQSSWKYGTGSFAASRYDQNAGSHSWHTAPVGTSAGDAITFTQAMTLDASGNLGIGTTSPTQKLDIKAASAATQITSTTGTNAVYSEFINTGGSFFVGRENSAGTAFSAAAYSSVIWSQGLYPLSFFTNSTLRMTLNSSGNLGLGVTPSAWATVVPVMQIGTGGAFIAAQGSASTVRLGANAYYDTGWKYTTTAAASVYQQLNGEHLWNTAASGTAGNAITFTQAMTLDASGRLLVGTTNAGSNQGMTIYNATQGELRLQNSTTGNTAADGFQLMVNGSDAYVFNRENAPLLFGTNDTERARIDSSGNLLVGATSPYLSEKFNVTQSADQKASVLFNTNASFTNYVVNLRASRNTSNSTYGFLQCSRDGVADVLYIQDSGNVLNTNNSYGQISDIKLKENIVDATPKLEKLNQVRVVNFNFIGDQQKQLGVIAQELEQVFPGMIDESHDKDAEGNDLGTTTKSVKYSVFVPMLIKAIQEQQALITTLTARITALEGA